MGVSGYRLHVVELRRERALSALDLENLDGNTAADLFMAQVSAIKGKTFVGPATYVDAEKADSGTTSAAQENLPRDTPILRVDEVSRVGERVEVWVSYGRAGDYDFVIHAGDGKDVPLNAGAAGRRYPVIFFGSRVGKQCVVASGVAGRTYVGTMLLSRLSVENYRLARKGSNKGDWRKWFPGVLVDEEHVREVVKRGKVEDIRLKRRGYDRAGQQKSRKLMLTQTGIRPDDRNKVVELVLGWVEAAAGKKASSSPHSAVAALIQLLDIDVDVSGFGFNDGALSFHEGGKTQSIAPSNLHRILTYTLEGDATIEDVRKGATGRIAAMKASLDGNFDQT